MSTYFLFTILMCVVTGFSVWYFDSQEQKRLYSRMLESRKKAVDEVTQKAVDTSITQFRLGYKAGLVAGQKDVEALRMVRVLTGEGRN